MKEKSTLVEFVPGRVLTTNGHEWLWLGWHEASGHKKYVEDTVALLNSRLSPTEMPKYQVYKITHHTIAEPA